MGKHEHEDNVIDLEPVSVVDTAPEPKTVYYVVSTIETTQGPAPAVLAAHKLICANLVAVLTACDNLFNKEVWDMDPDQLTELGEAYQNYLNTPAQIVAEAQGQSEDN